MQNTLNEFEDDVNQIRVLELDDLEDYVTKTKYGHEKEEGDRYLYSLKTGHVYYQIGLENSKGLTMHTYDVGSESLITTGFKDEWDQSDLISLSDLNDCM